MSRLTAAAVAGLMLPLLLSAPASGGDQRISEIVLRDGTSDVWASPVGAGDYTRRPAQQVHDVTRVVLAHRAHAIVVRMRFAGLARAGRQWFDVGIVTPDSGWAAGIAASPRNPDGRHTLYEDGGERPDRCAAMTHTIDYDSDLVTLRVPRSCVGDPAWVRMHSSNFRMTRSVLWTDNAHSAGSAVRRLTTRLHHAG